MLLDGGKTRIPAAEHRSIKEEDCGHRGARLSRRHGAIIDDVRASRSASCTGRRAYLVRSCGSGAHYCACRWPMRAVLYQRKARVELVTRIQGPIPGNGQGQEMLRVPRARRRPRRRRTANLLEIPPASATDITCLLYTSD